MGGSITFHSFDDQTGTFHGKLKNQFLETFFKNLFQLLQTAEETVCFNVLVLLSRNGDISVCALGTDPTLYAAPRPEARAINYEEADVELASLNTIIKATQTQGI